MKKKWWHNSVVYQIYPKSFYDSNNDGIGDINGIICKLDYLANLGVDVLWLSPVYQSPMIDNGYDISDYYEINPIFGTMKDMDNLIKEADNRGIKIIMDLVVNHTSDKHPWFIESRKNKDNPYRDYYIWRDKPNSLKSSFGGPAWEYDQLTNQYYFRRYSKNQPDLNWHNPNVRAKIYEMINWWIDKGIAGFRMDVIDKLGKDVDNLIVANGPKLHEYIHEMYVKTFGKYDLLTVGEAWSANKAIAEQYTMPENQELNMIFQFEHMTIDWGKHRRYSPIKLDFIKFKQIMSKWQTEYRGWNALFWNNHDLPRIVSRFGNDKEYRVESAKMLAILLHFMKGTPYIYQGEEIGMTNIILDDLSCYNDIECKTKYQELVVEGKYLTHKQFMEAIYKMGRDNSRTPMQWNNSFNAGFTKGTPWFYVNNNYHEINVDNNIKDSNSIFYTYQKLISLRRKSNYSDTILYGKYELILENHPQIFAYKRSDNTNNLLVIANFYDKETKTIIDEKIQKVIISNYKQVNIVNKEIKLRPYEAVVFELEKV